jgi:hypothetical protein
MNVDEAKRDIKFASDLLKADVNIHQRSIALIDCERIVMSGFELYLITGLQLSRQTLFFERLSLRCGEWPRTIDFRVMRYSLVFATFHPYSGYF